ncbi:hypothetical protein [Streptomyces sp.]|uniref:hypothetical protein n=1 Tax=Streptomyces sp. TaxID=1931 RepID=UPI0028121B2B|nr:hypothetical protein [Streptomyces sp.]
MTDVRHPARPGGGGAARRPRPGLSLSLAVTALLGAGACGSGAASPAPTGSAPATTAPTTTAAPAPPAAARAAAEAAKTVLDRAFAEREVLGAGSGTLAEAFGDTHPAPPGDVRGLTFAFVCTGGGTVGLAFTVADREVPSAAGAEVCDGSVHQRILGLPRPGALGFTAAVTGSRQGGYAYRYVTDRERRP